MATAKKPAKEVIYLDVDDDITTIIDKVGDAKDKIAALVLPKRFSTLQSIVNMRLLKRSADSAGKHLVLITSEAALLPLAGAAGIYVAKNLQSKPEIPPAPDIDEPKPAVAEDADAEIDAKDAKLDYHRSIGELAASDVVEEPETIPLEDADEEEKPAAAAASKTAKGKKPKVPNFDRFRLVLLLGGAGLILLIAGFIAANFVLPKATITLQTEATPISANFELTASDKIDSLDLKKGEIPAQLKTSDFTSKQDVQATGQKNNGKKASGSVKLSARKCSGNPTVIPSSVSAGTGITSGGVYYITQQSTTFTIPAEYDGGCYTYPSTGDTGIIAQSPGSNYNTSDANFAVPSRDVSGTGSASGGTDDIVTVLSQSDVDAAVNKVGDNEKKEFVDDFKKKLDGEDLYLIEETLADKKPAISASPAVGQPASTSSVTVKITYTVLAVSKKDMEKAVTEELNKQIDKSRQKIGTDDVLKDLEVEIQRQASPASAVLNISQDTTAVPTIDVEAVKKLAGGQKAGEIKAALRGYPGVKDVEVEMSPFWVSKAPKKPAKINVILQQVKTEDSGS